MNYKIGFGIKTIAVEINENETKQVPLSLILFLTKFEPNLILIERKSTISLEQPTLSLKIKKNCVDGFF